MASGQTQISSSNKGPIVNIVAWVFMVIMVLAVLTKIINKWQRTRSLMLDDLWIAIAAILAIGQTVAVSEQVSAGLGKPWESLDPAKISMYEKTGYASQILYVVVLCFAKMTTGSFMTELAPVSWVIWTTRSLLSFIGVWTVCAILVIAFQCGLPAPWHNVLDHCINQAAFWSIYAALDVLADIVLIAMPFIIVRSLQTSRQKRFEIIAAFAVRVIDIPLIILRLAFLVPALHSGSDSSSMYRPSLVTEVQMHMSVVLTCIPFIKAVIDSMQHGQIAGDMAYSTEVGSKGLTPGASYELKKYSKRLTGHTQKEEDLQHLRSGYPRLGRIEHPYSEISSQANARALSRTEHSGTQGFDQIGVETTITTELEKQKAMPQETTYALGR